MNLLKAEFRKVITLRFWWALLIGPLLVGLGASAFSASVLRDTDDFQSNELIAVAAFAGLIVAVFTTIMFAGLFGALNVGTEFAHKTLTPTFLTASGRDGVLGAKILVTAAFALFYGLVIETVSVLVVFVFSTGDATFDGDVLASLALGLYVIVCWGVIGAGFGMLFGSSLAAVLVVTAGPIGDLVLGTILAGLGADPVRYWLPLFTTFGTMIGGNAEDTDLFPPWPIPPILMFIYAVVFVGAGWLVARSRDIT